MEGIGFQHPQPAASICWRGEGTPDRGSLRVEGGAHIPSIPGALSVRGSRGEHAGLQRGDSGPQLWGLSQPGRTRAKGRERGMVPPPHARKREKWRAQV